jgi:Ca2+-binding RTX toxin-like protein
MTVYNIFPSCPPLVTTDDADHAFDLASGDIVLMNFETSIGASGRQANGIDSAGQHVELVLGGHVNATGDGATGVRIQGTVDVVDRGEVFGRFMGVQLVETLGENFLINSGRIEGAAAGVALNAAASTFVTNSGSIKGDVFGIVVDYWRANAGRCTIINKGLVEASDFAISGLASNGINLVNSGIIKGHVILSHMNDVYDGRGGTIRGDVYLGHGDDTAHGGAGDETFITGIGNNFLDAGGGIDTLIAVAPSRIDLRLTERQQTSEDSWDIIRNVENLNGSVFNDTFIGDTSANNLVGNDGNDTLDVYNGNDLLNGGGRNDLIVGGSGSDTAVFSGRFSDYTISIGASGTTTIIDNRAAGDGIDYLGGIEFLLFSDRIFTLLPPSAPSPAVVPTPSTPVASPAESLSFRGGKKAETLVGGSGYDYINGGLGRDILTGGEGQDTFAFTNKIGPKNIDRITDFAHAEDTISLSKAVFTKLQKGVLAEGAFWTGTKAHDGTDRIVYNDKTGVLSYDADGSGKKHAAIKFAQLDPKTQVAADDFFVV